MPKLKSVFVFPVPVKNKRVVEAKVSDIATHSISGLIATTALYIINEANNEHMLKITCQERKYSPSTIANLI